MLSLSLAVQDVRFKALIELKQLKLHALQQKIRQHVLVERWLQEDCTPNMLMDWGRMRRGPPVKGAGLPYGDSRPVLLQVAPPKAFIPTKPLQEFEAEKNRCEHGCELISQPYTSFCQ